jgi:DNA repair ATPase RecN
MSKLDEIKKALQAATPGPWEYEMWEGCADVYPTTGRHVPICQLWTKTEEPMENAENNAHLIANAPEWLQWAVQEIERLREENEGRKKIIEAYMRIEHDLAEDAERYLQQRDKLIEGLRVYLADLAERHHEAMQKWDSEADMYEQGAACAYDIAESMLRDILHEIGVTVE